MCNAMARTYALWTMILTMGFAGTVACQAQNAAPAFAVQWSAEETVLPGAPLAAAVVLTNPGDKPLSVTVDYSVQHDATLYNQPAPDPVYGSDQALGARSWTEAEGKTIAQGTLTDNKNWTAAETEYSRGHWTEAFQYIDLGKARTITRLTWEAGDANWLWKVDVSASLDGQTYTPIPSLQGFDMYKKWANQVFPLAQPVEARFLRFRYHKDQEKTNVFRMPVAIHVYDGQADEPTELPRVGRDAAAGQIKADLAPGQSLTLPLKSDAPMTPGAYLLALKAQDGQNTLLTWRHQYVMAPPFKHGGDSRFGFNTDTAKEADLMRDMGIGWMRFENLKWTMVSQEPHKYAFDGTVGPVNQDEILTAFKQRDIKDIPPLLTFARYANGKGGADEPYRLNPEDVDGFAEFCYQTAARYGKTKHPAENLLTDDKRSGLDLVEVFEIWNEPNHRNYVKFGGPDKFYEFFRRGADAVKKADPTAMVSNGGLSGIGVKLLEDMRNYKYADGKSPMDLTDIINVHFYTGQAPPELGRLNPNTAIFNTTDSRTFEENMELLDQWRNDNYPRLAIWMTETGYETAGTYGVDERTQAAWLPRDVMLILARGVDKVMVFRDIGSHESRWGSAGVLRDDLSKKPGFFTYATLIRELDGVKGSGLQVFTGNANVRIYAWPRNGKTVLTAWTIDGQASLGLDLGSATMTDSFGDRQEKIATGSLTLTPFPVYLTDFSNDAAVEAMLAGAQKRVQERQTAHQQALNQKAYQFGFGAKENVGGMFLGRYRPATGVLAEEVYDEQRGYGFVPQAGLSNDTVRRDDDQNRHAVKLNKGVGFKLRVEPGRYKLSISAVPFAATGKLTISGLPGGEKTVDISKTVSPVELEVQIGKTPITFNVDGYTMLSWVSLVRQEPTAASGDR